MRQRIFDITHRAKRGDHVSRLYDMFIVIIAVSSILPALFHANSLHPESQSILATIDVVTVYILTFDYILRWMTFDIEKGEIGDWKQFLKYPFTPGAIIDLLAILPTLNVLPPGFLFLRVLRIFRIFKYSRQLSLIANVFVEERKTLGSVFLLASAYIFVTALIMFTFEPETFETFLDAVYWSTITLTTIGFGDIHPVSDLGYAITTLSCIFGVFIFALPAGIMTGGFLQQLKLREEEGEDYYAGGWFGSVEWRKLCLTPRQAKAYFKDNPRVKVYLIFIIVGIALNFFLCLFFSELWQPLWLDTTGTAFVACVLDPAAALIVSFVDNLIIAVYQNSPGNILYFSESALVALIYGFMLKRGNDGKRPMKNSFIVLAIIILGQSLLSLILYSYLSGGNVTTPYQEAYRNFFLEAGLNYWLAFFLGLMVDRIFDAVSVFMLVSIGCGILNLKKFYPHVWISEQEMKVQDRKLKFEQENKVSSDLKHSEEENSPFETNAPDVKQNLLMSEGDVLCLNKQSVLSIEKGMRAQSSKAKNREEAIACHAGATALKLLQEKQISDAKDFWELFKKEIAKK